MSDPVEKTAVGACKEISIRGDWTTFHVDVGTQYPLKLSTKLAELVDNAKAFGAQPGTWHYKESQGNENPNRPGSYYMNRYLTKVEPLAQVPVTREEEPASPGTERELRITRLACLKAAAEFCASKPDSTQLGVISAAEAFEAWATRTAPEPGGQDFPEGFDDSIPF